MQKTFQIVWPDELGPMFFNSNNLTKCLEQFFPSKRFRVVDIVDQPDVSEITQQVCIVREIMEDIHQRRITNNVNLERIQKGEERIKTLKSTLLKKLFK